MSFQRAIAAAALYPGQWKPLRIKDGRLSYMNGETGEIKEMTDVGFDWMIRMKDCMGEFFPCECDTL